MSTINSIICILMCGISSTAFAGVAKDMSAICGTTANYRERAMAVQRLGTSLSTNEIQELYAFLGAHVDEKPDLSPKEQASLKNAIADVLVSQKQLPSDLGEQILANYRDAEHDVQWRLHCLGQMASWWAKRKLGGWEAGRLGSECEEIMAAVRAAASGTNDECACVGLLALTRIGDANAGVSPQEAVSLATAIATNAVRSAGLRATAIGIAAKAGKSDILPAARTAAQDESAAGLQHAAIRAIGMIGTADDKAMVQGLAQSGNPATAAAAQEALRRFAERRL